VPSQGCPGNEAGRPARLGDASREVWMAPASEAVFPCAEAMPAARVRVASEKGADVAGDLPVPFAVVGITSGTMRVARGAVGRAAPWWGCSSRHWGHPSAKKGHSSTQKRHPSAKGGHPSVKKVIPQ
jgi:hypothetical protein